MSGASDDVILISLPTPFPVGPVNVFLIREDPPILVDAGIKTDEAYDALVAGLDEYGVAVRDIATILITHGHMDHVGLLGRLVAECGAEVYAHPYAVERFRDEDRQEDKEHRRFLIEVLREFGMPEDVVEVCLEERESFRVFETEFIHARPLEDGDRAGRFTAHHVPGHSPSDTLFVDSDRGLAFTGDHVLKGINPNPLIRRPRPGAPRPKSLVEYRASLERTRSLNPSICYPGHGDAFTDAGTVIDRILSKQDRRTSHVERLLLEGEVTPYALSRELFPDLEPRYVFLGLSVAVGHLELLEEECRAVAKHRQGVLHYAPLVSGT